MNSVNPTLALPDNQRPSVKLLIDKFSMQKSAKPPAAKSWMPFKKIDLSDISLNRLSPTQKKVLGIAMIVMAIGMTVIPFVLPLTLGVGIAITLLSSSVWYMGSFIKRSGVNAQKAELDAKDKFLGYKATEPLPGIVKQSSRVKKAIGVASVVGAICLGIIPCVKEISMLVKLAIYGGAFIVGSIGSRLYDKECYADEFYRASKLRLAEIQERSKL